MICPACENNLSQLVAGGVMLDVCNGGCGGIWFDSFELQKIEAAQEATEDLDIDVPRDPNRSVDYAKRRSCPKCNDVVLMRHYFSKLRQVVVDECPNCGGFWLDAGESDRVRELMRSRVGDLRRSSSAQQQWNRQREGGFQSGSGIVDKIRNMFGSGRR